MIQANELRIGNYYQENGKYYKVDINDLVNLVRCGNNGVESDMKPIPLTEEILLKCGFVDSAIKQRFVAFKDKERRFYIKNDICISIRNDEYFFCIRPTKAEQGFDIISIITSLHQLQNLYFALTGKELEISLND